MYIWVQNHSHTPIAWEHEKMSTQNCADLRANIKWYSVNKIINKVIIPCISACLTCVWSHNWWWCRFELPVVLLFAECLNKVASYCRIVEKNFSLTWYSRDIWNFECLPSGYRGGSFLMKGVPAMPHVLKPFALLVHLPDGSLYSESQPRALALSYTHVCPKSGKMIMRHTISPQTAKNARKSVIYIIARHKQNHHFSQINIFCFAHFLFHFKIGKEQQ